MTDSVVRLLDLGSVATAWHVSPHTVRKWVKQGRLKPVRICRRLLFHPDELARFIRAGQCAQTSSPANAAVHKFAQHDHAESLAPSPRPSDHLTIRGSV
jgi:DNA-binding transcriptional MerR regulator